MVEWKSKLEFVYAVITGTVIMNIIHFHFVGGIFIPDVFWGPIGLRVGALIGYLLFSWIIGIPIVKLVKKLRS